MQQYEAHLFICTHKREDGSSACGDKNSTALLEELKFECKEKYGKRVRINRSGCLGFCQKGIVSVLYPQSKWFFDLKADEESKSKIAQEIQKNFN